MHFFLVYTQTLYLMHYFTVIKPQKITMLIATIVYKNE
jgi:hypothetical protein